MTVACILEAAERVARRDGFYRLETSKIAAAAGISIGSLYQYFPDREAIALALYEERSKEVALTMKKAMVGALDQPSELALPGIMELILSLHEQHQLILHRMQEEMPQLKLSRHPISVDHLVRGSVAHYLQYQDPTLTAAEINRKTFLVENMVLGCIRRYLAEPLGIPRDAFIRDLARACWLYLSPDPLSKSA